MSESPILEYWPEGIAAARIPANNNVRLLQALKINPAISATTAAQPGSPAEGDVYILPASPSGSQWAGFFEGDVVIYYSATWTAYAPVEGLRKFVEDEGEDWQYVGDSSGGWAPAGGGGGMTNPMTTAGDIIIGGVAGAPARLAAGATAGHVLTSNGSGIAPSYQAGGGAVSSVNSQTGAVSLDAADIPITDAGGYFTSTDVEGALQELGAGGGGGAVSSPISVISGTTYTGAAADDRKTLVFTNTSAKSATIDPDATTALPANWELIINNKGASNLTVIAGSGVTITAPAGGTLVIPPAGTAALKRVATDDFFLAGNTL